MENGNEAIMQLKGISFSYPKVLALDGVSLNLEEKGIYGLLGPNGAGKTTLMKILLGFLTPQSGQGKVLGHDLRQGQRQIRQRIGYMPEIDCLIPGMDAVSETAYLGQISGMPRSEAMKRAHEVLYYVGLGEERYRKVETYSTGMKQRLKLAQALVHDPQLLFLDEPTSGMDPKGRREILDLIRDIGVKGSMSLIVSSHLLPDVESTCENVLILNRGRIVAQEAIRNLSHKAKSTYEVKFHGDTSALIQELTRHGCILQEQEKGISRLSLPPSFPVGDLFALAHHHHVQVRHFKKCQTTLEDAFMQAIGEDNGY